MINKIVNFFKNLFVKRQFKQKMERIQKRDPFVYWSEEDWGKKKIKLPKVKGKK